jgi:uncharacterized protein
VSAFLSPSEIATAMAVAAAGALVQGGAGFGLALLAAPLLVLIDPRFIPGPMLLSALVLTVVMAFRGRQTIHVRGVAWTIVGRVPGVVAGLATITILRQKELAVLFAALVLIAVVMTASGISLHPKRGTLLAAGALSGFMGTVAAIGGPPVALVYQHRPGPELRSTLAGYFVAGSSMSLLGLAAVGRFGRDELLLAAVLVPAILVGYFASHGFARWLDRGRTRAAILVVSALSAALVLLQELG